MVYLLVPLYFVVGFSLVNVLYYYKVSVDDKAPYITKTDFLHAIWFFTFFWPVMSLIMLVVLINTKIGVLRDFLDKSQKRKEPPSHSS